MNRKSTLLICGGIMLAFALGLWISQPSVGQVITIGKEKPPPQPPPSPPSKVGKYQITGAGNSLYLCDTENGRLWYYTNSSWKAMASPVSQVTGHLVPGK